MKKHLRLPRFTKRILPLALLATFWMTKAMAAPDERLLSQFNHAFPGAEYIRWTEDQGFDIVSFTWNDTPCRIWYDKDGVLVYSLRYRQESELPLKVQLAINRKYNEKHVEGFVELTNRSGITYEVMLSDDKKYFMISATAYGDVSLKYTLRKQE
ncbi:hypothetical protein F0L74_08950 [Chitinophaga agrisoli]|uniref:PepSY-like beta-lactamase-inhibitor n=1 Tax=Chitinophaga agrisoli TaxID=2607653 RepID=A0A5B2VXB2_9BACT|nr:hypothetical protein [Chitinophaga agrisoli]KAA2242649.1 hypothetical protein F0L74_08950 [Chitinophaga agrisoli]